MTVVQSGFGLGKLYDIRSSTLYGGYYLWSPEFIANNTYKRLAPGTEFNVEIDDSIGKKASLLGVSAEVTASFCAGAVELAGAVKFLMDKDRTSTVSKVSAVYTETTSVQSLDMVEITKEINSDALRRAEGTGI